MCVQALKSCGHVRNASGNLYDIRECASNCFQLSTLVLMCPITSIFVGLGRLENLNNRRPDVQDSTFKYIYYFTTAVLACLGLGIILAAIRIAISIILLPINITANMLTTISKLLSPPSYTAINQFSTSEKRELISEVMEQRMAAAEGIVDSLMPDDE